ncbi:hypothetical protein HYH03_007767 [Edaphochlamys debaryana]|uniref:Uncharacterized protein n=1 Tax=Edaphochlamys debaryana TaxID=47281 RepID=A0A835Y2P5_9CHLO|nr:hypothetical protein HYH03_007767 [Edaphochlamys debaryana]|eukprot:KAG2494129.1 hypothetical protein HYH03_007767 [Edaphochlamys debaryana]
MNQLTAAFVVPGEEEVAQARAAVSTVVKVLQKVPEVKVDRVHVGGSFGRKTSVKGRFDVDLSVFVNGLDPDPHEAATVLQAAASRLEVCMAVPVRQKPGMRMLEFTWDELEVDLCLVQNVARWYNWNKAAKQVEVLVGPLLRMTDAEVAALEDQAGPNRARERGVGEALTAFVKAQPGTATEAVRLFKAWVKCGLGERGLLDPSKLPSVALELLLLHAFLEEERAPSSEFDGISPGRSLLLRTFLGALDTASRLDEPGGGPVVMLDAGALGYRREQGERFRACWGAEGPFVIHPIDPTCNVAKARDDGRPAWDWPALALEARALLTVVRHTSLETLLSYSTLGAALDRLAALDPEPEREPELEAPPTPGRRQTRLPPCGGGAGALEAAAREDYRGWMERREEEEEEDGEENAGWLASEDAEEDCSWLGHEEGGGEGGEAPEPWHECDEGPRAWVEEVEDDGGEWWEAQAAAAEEPWEGPWLASEVAEEDVDWLTSVEAEAEADWY